MKKLISILLLATLGCGKSFAQFHIKVECYGRYKESQQPYIIKYTKDNWKTERSFNECIDLSEMMEMESYIFYKPKLFVNNGHQKQDAINFASKFNSFKMCDDYNQGIFNKYLRIKEYRRVHPFKKKTPSPALIKQACCKTIKIY